MNEDAQVHPEALSHEPIETDVRDVWITGVVITSVAVAAFLVVFWMMKWFTARNGGPAATLQAAVEPAKTNPHWNVPPQFEALRTLEQEYLHTYRWVDQRAGVARIPIDRAVEIIAAEGLPANIPAAVQAQGDAEQGRAELQDKGDE